LQNYKRLENKNNFLKILIVGNGSIANRHINVIKKIFTNVLIGITSRDEKKVIERGDGIILVKSPDIESFNPDLAIIANPSSFREEICLRLARQKVSMLIEKPFTDNPLVAMKLINAFSSCNATIGIGYNLRYLPSLLKFKSLIDDQAVGDILSVKVEVGSFLPDWRKGSDYRNSVSANKSLGGGVLRELSHEIDYLQWIFGDISKVSAITHSSGRLEVDVEDIANLMVEFTNPRDGLKTLGLIGMDFMRQDSARSCTAIGSMGTLKWDFTSKKVDLFLSKSEGWVNIFSDDNDALATTYETQLKSFMKALVDKSTYSPCQYDGLKAVCIINAAEISSRIGSAIEMEPIYRKYGVLK
jgi:predicted dehydrogenase